MELHVLSDRPLKSISEWQHAIEMENLPLRLGERAFRVRPGNSSVLSMKKSAYFDSHWGSGWPAIQWLEPYFLAPPGKRWFFATGNDSAGFDLEGVDGTGHLPANKGRIDIRLSMWGHPSLGVFLMYEKSGGGYRDTFSSRGDLTKLNEWVRSTHDTPLPVGLFIPYEQAWQAVKEFIETEGKRPTSIAWIANRDLPPNTFPDP
jgi:hypothetical protein